MTVPALVLFQSTSEITDDQLRLIVVALLGVAALLALLTIWYAVHTSPRRRERVAQARARMRAAQRAQAEADRRSQPSPFDDPAVIEAQADADWMQLTGPQPSPEHRSPDSPDRLG